MNIVKRDSWRSQGTMVNKTDDMYRVVVDMTRGEFFAFSQWAARREAKEEPDNSHQHSNGAEPTEIRPSCNGTGSGGRTITGDEYYCSECDGSGKPRHC